MRTSFSRQISGDGGGGGGGGGYGDEGCVDELYYQQKGLFQRAHAAGTKQSFSKKQVRATDYQKEKRAEQRARDKPPVLDGSD